MVYTNDLLTPFALLHVVAMLSPSWLVYVGAVAMAAGYIK